MPFLEPNPSIPDVLSPACQWVHTWTFFTEWERELPSLLIVSVFQLEAVNTEQRLTILPRERFSSLAPNRLCMGNPWLEVDGYLSSRSSSPVSTPDVSAIRRLIPLEPLIEQELKSLPPLAPKVIQPRPPLPKLESYPQDIVDVFSRHTTYTSMPSVLDDPIWKSKRLVSHELGVYTSISESSNGVEVSKGMFICRIRATLLTKRRHCFRWAASQTRLSRKIRWHFVKFNEKRFAR